MRPHREHAGFDAGPGFWAKAHPQADFHVMPCRSSSFAGVSCRACKTFGWRRRVISDGRVSNALCRKVLLPSVMVDFSVTLARFWLTVFPDPFRLTLALATCATFPVRAHEKVFERSLASDRVAHHRVHSRAKGAPPTKSILAHGSMRFPTYFGARRMR